LLVVGGSPTTRRELSEAIGQRVFLRLVDGTERRTKKKAEQDCAWADLVVIWGSTELNHGVSNLYPPPRLVAHCRGVGSLADEVIRHLDGINGRKKRSEELSMVTR
jgi:hypothetical protein